MRPYAAFINTKQAMIDGPGMNKYKAFEDCILSGQAKMHSFKLGLLSQLATAAAVHFSPLEYSTIKHANHPTHQIVYKHNGIGLADGDSVVSNKTATVEEVCPGATPGHSGYLISGTKHFFFTFFQSRSQPETDPLVLWSEFHK